MRRIGSLFSGYGGLDLAIHSVIESETVFVADICGNGRHKTKCGSPCTILAHRFPDAPNLGDVSLIDWSEWQGKVDILSAGFPCQDVSHAGKRAGLKDGTRTGLWSEVVRAIIELRPELVVLENVLGIYTAPATSDMEPCAWCVGDGSNGDMRALDAVLADLAEIGFDAEWINLRASDVGAPHRRERWFCVAYPQGVKQREQDVGAIQPELVGSIEGDLMPTPAVNDMGAAYTPEQWDVWTEKMRQTHGNGNGHGKSLSVEAQRLMPAPTAHLAKEQGSPGEFGNYAQAISRWERILGRPAPAPTQPSKTGRPQLSPRFTEWMMGLPAGWVSDVPDIRRNEALKACGNGVVPQQASAALRALLERAS